MPSPVTPEDFKEAIPSADASICTKFVTVFFKLPHLIYQFMDWMLDSNGNLTDEFKAEAGISTGTLDAPTGVTASKSTDENDITVSWSAVSGATKYDIYRSTVDDSGTSNLLIGERTDTSYVDTPPSQDTQYFYWVKAKSDTAVSSFSTSDWGMASATAEATGTKSFTSPGDVEWDFTGQNTTTATIKIWGAGGSGGNWFQGTYPVGVFPFGGGGGGSGEYREITNVTIDAGETLKISIGAGGPAIAVGSTGYTNSGVNGEPTILRRANDDDIGAAAGGKGGGIGYVDAAGGAGAGGLGGTGGSGGSVPPGIVGVTGDAGTSNKTGGSGGTAVSSPGTNGNGPLNVGGDGGDTRGRGGDGKIEISW